MRIASEGAPMVDERDREMRPLSGNVIRIDPSSDRIVDDLPVQGSPEAMTVDASGAVWVAVHSL